MGWAGTGGEALGVLTESHLGTRTSARSPPTLPRRSRTRSPGPGRSGRDEAARSTLAPSSAEARPGAHTLTAVPAAHPALLGQTGAPDQRAPRRLERVHGPLRSPPPPPKLLQENFPPGQAARALRAPPPPSLRRPGAWPQRLLPWPRPRHAPRVRPRPSPPSTETQQVVRSYALYPTRLPAPLPSSVPSYRIPRSS